MNAPATYNEIEFLIQELKATYPVFSGFTETVYNAMSSTHHAEQLYEDIIDIGIEE